MKTRFLALLFVVPTLLVFQTKAQRRQCKPDESQCLLDAFNTGSCPDADVTFIYYPFHYISNSLTLDVRLSQVDLQNVVM